MAGTSTKIRRLAEVEMMRAELKARRAGKRVLVIAIGVIIGAFALIFLTYGTFLWGAAHFGAVETAMTMGGTLLVIAAIAIAYATLSPSRADEIESELLVHAIEEARNDVRADLDALEARFDKVSGGLAKMIDGRKEEGANGPVNLATITLLLSAIGAASPTLNRYIQPILKILS